jgi:hypothetical protein
MKIIAASLALAAALRRSFGNVLCALPIASAIVQFLCHRPTGFGTILITHRNIRY